MTEAHSELSWRAMGTEAHVVVVADTTERADQLTKEAQRRIADLEARWSRFLPTSELSRLNGNPNRPTVVSQETFLAISTAVDGWQLTGGRYDPTTLRALMAAGYDRTFGEVAPQSEDPTEKPGPAPGCGSIVLMASANAVVLPPGVTLDLGGVGKGLAADLVVTELLQQGALGACVNLGGDVRVKGRPPDGAWRVGVEDPWEDGVLLLQIALADGAVVTTTPLTRRWTRAGRPLHHLIDPATGAPAVTDVASVTVVAAEAWRAEVFAKAAYLAGVDAGLDLLTAAGLTGGMVGDDHCFHAAAGLEAYRQALGET
jgi:thiamine biosynthesis lipoprotein